MSRDFDAAPAANIFTVMYFSCQIASFGVVQVEFDAAKISGWGFFALFA